MASSDRYTVLRPYQVAIGKTQFTNYFPRSDKMTSLRAAHMVSLETLEANGAGRKKRSK